MKSEVLYTKQKSLYSKNIYCMENTRIARNCCKIFQLELGGTLLNYARILKKRNLISSVFVSYYTKHMQ